MLDQTLLSNYRTNNVFDIDLISSILQEAKLATFENLMNFQRQLNGLKRFDLKMSDLNLISNIDKKTRIFPRKFVGVLNGEFIDKKKRLLYKRSSLFNKELSIFDISQNTNIFSFNFLPFVDGKFIDSLKILPSEEKTLLILSEEEVNNPNGVSKQILDDLMQRDAKITVFFIPNTEYGLYTVNRTILNTHKNKLSLQSLGLSNNLDTETKYVNFVVNNKLLFKSIINNPTASNQLLKFVNNSSLPPENKTVHLNIFGLRNIIEMQTISGTQKYFKVPLKNMPIPKDSILIFRNDGSDNKTFAHDITLTHYYPNVFKVEGNTTNSKLTVLIFYGEDNQDVPLSYRNEIELYMNRVTDYLQRFENDTIPQPIKNYNPYTFKYSIDDFRTGQGFTDTFDYKVKKFNEIVEKDPFVFSEYLRRKVEDVKGYYLDLSTINLSTRVRTNNFQEITDYSQQESFQENRYLFILKNEYGAGFQHLRFYIDGIAYVPDKKYKDSKYEYYYIPTNMVRSDSIIEIEKFDPINFYQTVRFTSTNENKEFTIDNYSFSRNDIFLIKKSDNTIISKDNYTVYMIENGQEIDLGQSSFKKLPNGKFRIKVNTSGLVNVDIEVRVQRETIYKEYKITNLDEVGDSFSFKHFVNPEPRNFRIFRNGRLLSQNLYEMKFLDNKYGGEILITPLVKKEIGDTFIIDYCPVSYRVVYESPSIESTQGVVSLKGVIERPFDLKWYDVYLNGRRLSKRNIDILSPNLISVKNVSSLKNLIIIERDSDPNIFKVNPSYTSIVEEIWNSDNTFRNNYISSRPSVTNTEIDIITQIIADWSLEAKRFFKDYMLLNKMLLNPDVNQIGDNEKNLYSKLFNGNVVLLNPDRDFSSTAITLVINADS